MVNTITLNVQGNYSYCGTRANQPIPNGRVQVDETRENLESKAYEHNWGNVPRTRYNVPYPMYFGVRERSLDISQRLALTANTGGSQTIR